MPGGTTSFIQISSRRFLVGPLFLRGGRMQNGLHLPQCVMGSSPIVLREEIVVQLAEQLHISLFDRSRPPRLYCV